MTGSKLIDDISEKLASALQHSPMRDIDSNLKALLASALQKLDLVTREEFDVQQHVLLRTREQLTALETRIHALEQACAPEPAAVPSESATATEPAALTEPSVTD